MKLTVSNALLILALGMGIVLMGVFLKVKHHTLANPLIFTGLFLDFIGTVWFVLSLYRRRKS